MDKEKENKLIKESRDAMPFAKNNYIGMAVAGFMIVAGFLLMLGGSSTAEAFNPEIFSARRIVIGPFLAFIGFVGMAVAIAVRPKR